MKKLYCIKLHNIYVFVGTLKECRLYFDKKVKNTFGELYCEILEYDS